MTNQKFALGFTLLYALLLGWFMQYHELWFDETEPWLLALYSNSYADLLHNKRFEGHPNLWYSLLYIITKSTSSLRALQVTQAVFAVGFVYVFLRYAPFPRVLKVLICFGYYGLFEYGIISRLYALELFTLFLLCHFYPKRFSHWYLYLTLLAVHAQTNLFGFFFSGVMGLVLFSEAFRLWKETAPLVSLSTSQKVLGLLLWTLGCAFSFWSMVRPNETGGNLITFWHPYYFYQAASRIWQAFAPVPVLIIPFWNTSFLRTVFEIPLSALLMALIVGKLYRTKQLLIPLLLLFITLLLFFALKWEGSIRHHAHFFFYTLAFLWLQSYYGQGNTLSHPFQFLNRWSAYLLPYVLLICASLQVVAGVYALSVEKKYPFYGGKQVAQFLQTLPATSVVVINDLVTASNVTAYYGRPVLHLPTGVFRSFYTLDPNEVNDLGPYRLLDWAGALAQRINKPVVLICREELPYQWHSSPVKFLKAYKGDYITSFSFFIYEIPPLPLPKKYMVADLPLKKKTP